MWKKLLIIFLVSLSFKSAKSQYYWDSVGSGVNHIVRDLVSDTINDILYLSGDFYRINSIDTALHFAYWDGSIYHKLACGKEFIGSPKTAALYNGDLVTGGNMLWLNNASCGGQDIYTKMRYNFSTNSWSTIGTSWGTNVYTMTTFQGNLICGGEITMIDYPTFIINANNITLWDGSQWQALGPTGNYGLTQQSNPMTPWVWGAIEFNGELFVSGVFDHAGGVPLNFMGMARWNGVSWNSAGIAPGVPMNGNFCIYNNELYFGAELGAWIYKWNGFTWSLFATLTNPGNVTAMVVWNNKLVVTGKFTSVEGVPANSIAVWDGIQWSALGSGLNCNGGLTTCIAGNGVGYALGVYSNELYVGGSFDHAGGLPALNIARWRSLSGINNESNVGTIKVNLNENQTKLIIYGKPATYYSGAIYNLAGSSVITFSNKTEVDIAKIPNNIYIIKIIEPSGSVVSKKIVITRK